jgi:hypothetical protein
MGWLILTVDEFRHIFSVLIAEFLLVLPSIKKRSRFALRLSICILCCCIIGSLYAVFYTYLYAYMGLIAIIWYVIIAVEAGAVIAICFEINLTSLIWVMLAAYAVEHFVYVAIIEVIFIGAANDAVNFWLQLLTYSAVCAGIYLLFYKIFAPNIKYLGNFYLKDNLKNRLFFIVFYVVFLASTLLNQLNARHIEESFNYLSAVSDLINCLFVIIVQFVGLTTSRINFEKQFSDKLLKDEKRQYEAFKNSVDYVNIKCHDLKHELRLMRQSGNVNTAKLEEIAQGATLYEAFAKTGNETLDILLTEKNLTCIANGIALTYMADASALSAMDVSDIYSLFGNLLDNAIEYVQKLEDNEKRFIRLFVKPQGGMLIIHEENYLEGSVQFVDGLPQTTKGDTEYHGFGFKSMQRTAKKYGGDLRISADGGIFKVDVFIQIR